MRERRREKTSANIGKTLSRDFPDKSSVALNKRRDFHTPLPRDRICIIVSSRPRNLSRISASKFAVISHAAEYWSTRGNLPAHFRQFSTTHFCGKRRAALFFCFVLNRNRRVAYYSRRCNLDGFLYTFRPAHDISWPRCSQKERDEGTQTSRAPLSNRVSAIRQSIERRVCTSSRCSRLVRAHDNFVFCICVIRFWQAGRNCYSRKLEIISKSPVRERQFRGHDKTFFLTYCFFLAAGLVSDTFSRISR